MAGKDVETNHMWLRRQDDRISPGVRIFLLTSKLKFVRPPMMEFRRLFELKSTI